MTPLKILHVDDEDDIREVAAFALELDPAVELRSAASGQAALSVLEEGFAPDVILLDVMMPGLDGPGALRLIRQRSEQATTPVIFMTARAQSGEVDQYRRLGALDVITKPFDPMILAADVRAILAGAGA
ncbi:MAG TPA: response regulator [Brevundimonas sp.]|jgi:CheY-like chemotaxis protein|uniref:response regulator n=1 Tax=Brevundimonas sp. TaxID=1871086 RepID=UPI002ED928F4